jgi:DNA-binding NarL/FixJ family response regulator
MKRITGLLAEDHTVVREGFRKLLEKEDDLEVVGETEDGCRTVALVKKLRPTVIVTDVAMPLLNGLEAASSLPSFSVGSFWASQSYFNVSRVSFLCCCPIWGSRLLSWDS